MFDALTTRFQEIFNGLRRETRLTPGTVEAALNQIRMALLEADVHFMVVKAFVDRVRDRAIEHTVLESLTPVQQVVGIVRDEMRSLLGEGTDGLRKTAERPQVVIVTGLQGSGKTTTCAKLGRWMTRNGRNPLLVSTDVRRPAAITQLTVLCEQAGLRVHDPATDRQPAGRAVTAVREARELGFDSVIVDTAGRLHVDEELMAELEAIRAAVRPSDVLYVADAMAGQDAIKSAGAFHQRHRLTGLILSKMDGDARGGAALSVASVVRVPIVFSGVGERLDDLALFQPDRLVSRILGMGDMLTFIERAEQAASRDDAEQLQQALRHREFTLEDLRGQMVRIARMGPLDQLIGMLPGMKGGAVEASANVASFRRVTAIIDSMTPAERYNAALIDGSRRKRIARGSGTNVQEVNRLLKQFQVMRRTVAAVASKSASRRGKKRGRRSRLGLAPPRERAP